MRLAILIKCLTMDRKAMSAMYLFAFICIASALEFNWLTQANARITNVEANRKHLPISRPESRGVFDFTAILPMKSHSDLMQSRSDSVSTDLPVDVQGLRIDPDSAPAKVLPFTDRTIELRGRYPAIKDWLNQQLADHSGVALLTLDLRRGEVSPVGAASNASVNATVRLRQYMRPRLTSTLGQPPQAPGTTAFP